MAVVQNILQVHRPAHTVFEICSVDAGMRVGQGLLLELTSVIGRSAGFSRLQLGASALGRGAVVGPPRIGARLGSAELGRSSTVA